MFNEEERKAFEEFSKPEISKDLNWIKLSNITEAIDEEGYISFSLPNREEYRMKLTRSEFSDENNFVYAAQREEEDGEPTGDDLVIVNVGGYISASIQVGDEFFRIIPITPETQILVKARPEMPNWCGTPDIESQATQAAECKMDNKSCTIKIMYVIDIDSETKTFLSKNSIISLCKLWTEELNTTLKNSDVKHKFEQVWIEFLDKPMAFINDDCRVSSFQKEYITNTNSPVYIARQQSEADIVIFLTTRNSHFAYCQREGKAFTIGAKNSNEAFAIVKLDAAVQWLTVVHETGHLMGGRHEDDNDAPPAKAHQFYVKSELKRTMMFGDKTYGARIKYFSNPNVKLGGTPTGEVDKFNACVIQNQGCITAGLVADNKCAFTLGGVFDKACNPTKLDLNILGTPLNCLNSAYTYTFEYSIDGKTFTKSCSAKSSKCTINLSSNPKNYIVFVRVLISISTSSNPLQQSIDKVYSSFSVTGCKSN